MSHNHHWRVVVLCAFRSEVLLWDPYGRSNCPHQLITAARQWAAHHCWTVRLMDSQLQPFSDATSCGLWIVYAIERWVA